MLFPKIDLHVHSNFSDGRNTIKQLTRKALKLELDYLAITDHFSDSWKASYISTLNTPEKIDAYLKIISDIQSELISTNKNLKILKGVEIDLGCSIKSIENLIKPNEFDLILFEYLESPEAMKFAEDLIKKWKNTGNIRTHFPLFGLAHFDPSYFLYSGLDEFIIFLHDNDIFFEFNSRYPEYYSRKNLSFFDKLRENGVPVSLGSDTHSIRRLFDLLDPLKAVKDYELESNLLSLINRIKNKKI